MGCNCKKDANGVEIKGKSSDEYKKKPLIEKGGMLVVKIFIFIFAAITATIIVIPFSIYMLFKVIFLDEGSMDLTAGLISIGKKLKKKDDDDDDEEEFEFEDEDEIMLMNAE